jgi:signal transduction histidine kinase
MSEQVWYRSLYWRIGIGFVVLLATLLAVQGLAFLWLTGRMAELWPGRSPAEFAQVLAADASTALAESPDLDLNAYLNERYSSAYRAFVVVMRDGAFVRSARVAPPPLLGRAARTRLFSEANPDATGLGRRGRGGRGDGGRGAEPGDPEISARDPEARGRDGSGNPSAAGGRGGRGGRGLGGLGAGTAFAPVVVAGETVGMAAVPVDPVPLSLALRDFGPLLAAVAFGLLAVGTTVAALLVFGPARRRLGVLQEAARAIGEGRSAVRAPVSGGDEVASLAQTFNEMAAGLEERSQALAEADRTRRQLLADVSHELMTPLSAIRGYVETLGMADVELDDAARSRSLQVIGEESERLEHIIGDLLDLARLEGGGGTLKIEAITVDHLLERVRRRHERLLAEKNIVLETDRDAAVETIRGDQNRLEQAVQNLVANAIRHTPEGGRVSVTVDRADDDVRVVVEDTGTGIPDEHLSHVFDRFYKVDGSRTGTETPSGSGLGLSIVQAIVMRHGGRVTASNVESGGARFEMTVPQAAA